MIMQPMIFYVDDDSDDLTFFKAASDALGSDVKLFHEGDDLLDEIMKLPPPNVVFVDLNMPRKTGYDVMKEIRKQANFKDLPVVVYSTASDPYTIRRCRDSGASLYVKKPTSMKAIQNAIKYVLGINWSTYHPSPKNFVYHGK